MVMSNPDYLLDLWCIACGVVRLSVANEDRVCDGCKDKPRIVSLGIFLHDPFDEHIHIRNRFTQQARSTEIAVKAAKGM